MERRNSAAHRATAGSLALLSRINDEHVAEDEARQMNRSRSYRAWKRSGLNSGLKALGEPLTGAAGGRLSAWSRRLAERFFWLCAGQVELGAGEGG